MGDASRELSNRLRFLRLAKRGFGRFSFSGFILKLRDQASLGANDRNRDGGGGCKAANDESQKNIAGYSFFALALAKQAFAV